MPFPGIAGGIDARGAAEGVHLQSGVVGETGQVRQGMDVTGLDQGILLQRGAGLLNLAVDSQLRRRQQLEAGTENLRSFAELASVGRGKYDLHGRKGSGKNWYLCIYDYRKPD